MPGPDQTQPGRGNPSSRYVRSEYIGTGGWHLSPTLCGQWVNKPTGLQPVLLTQKPLTNFVEGNFTWETRAPERAGVSERCDRLARPRKGAHAERSRPFFPMPKGTGLLADER